MAMLVIAFEDLEKPVETSYSGYCASHPPLALPENLESRRYREVWFPDTLFFLPFRHTHIHLYQNQSIGRELTAPDTNCIEKSLKKLTLKKSDRGAGGAKSKKSIFF